MWFNHCLVDQESNQWLLGASGFSMWLISVPAAGDNKQPNCSQKGSVDSSQPQAVASLNQTFGFTYTLPARRSAHPMLACRVFLHLIHLTSFLTISEKTGFKKCLINWSSAVQARCVLQKKSRMSLQQIYQRERHKGHKQGFIFDYAYCRRSERR